MKRHDVSLHRFSRRLFLSLKISKFLLLKKKKGWIDENQMNHVKINAERQLYLQLKWLIPGDNTEIDLE